MTPLAIALAVAVLALLWFAAKPNTTNHAERDEAARKGGFTYERTDQKTRLEIVKALEKEFPDRLVEDLLDLARYVEGDGTPVSTFAREFLKANTAVPRKWTNLDAIPSNVKAITDKDGDRAEPQTLKGKRKWVFTDEPIDGLGASPDDGPFTEALENK